MAAAKWLRSNARTFNLTEWFGVIFTTRFEYSNSYDVAIWILEVLLSFPPLTHQIFKHRRPYQEKKKSNSQRTTYQMYTVKRTNTHTDTITLSIVYYITPLQMKWVYRVEWFLGISKMYYTFICYRCYHENMALVHHSIWQCLLIFIVVKPMNIIPHIFWMNSAAFQIINCAHQHTH